jgi:hypothetical protein
MIRQPLQRIGSPLADCDYHLLSAPWREKFTGGHPHGRGAAGRPIAREAFCFALEKILTDSGTEAGLRHLLADALSAFSADHTYAAAMARAAVTIASKKYSAVLRVRVRQVAHQAVSQCDLHRGEFQCPNQSPCGTGDCRFAQGDLVLVTRPSFRGKMKRPANSTAPGSTFSPDDALPEFEHLCPFTVPIPVRDADELRCVDAVAPS